MKAQLKTAQDWPQGSGFDNAGSGDLDHGNGDLAEMLMRHLPLAGLYESPVSGVRLFRCDQPMGRAPCIYEPCVVIVVQGTKRGYFGTRTIDYTPSGYVVFSVPITMESEIISASSQKPFLGIALTIEPAPITDLQMRIDEEVLQPLGAPESISVSRIDQPFHNALVRLVATFSSQTDSRVLGPMVVNEIFYRVLLGNQGSVLRAAAHRHSHYHRLSQLLKTIQSDCSVNLTTTDMARIANMSKTALHENFRLITSMSPLQYVKSVRLHQARALMLNEGLNASTAAYRVGYASASQFSREFKRLFGRSPRLEVQHENVNQIG